MALWGWLGVTGVGTVMATRVPEWITAVDSVNDAQPLVDDATEFLEGTDPLVVSLAVLAGVAVLVAGWWTLRWIRRPPGIRLRRVLAKRDEVAILLHPDPDPDAMACAMGVERIAESVDTDVTIQYPGQIGHQENQAFRNVLEMDLERIEGTSDIASDDIVLVDQNTARGFTGAPNLEPIIVIDHHPGNGRGTAFTDVRTDYGAASSIVTEYLQELGATHDTDADENATFTISTELSTGLMYGIHSDTNHLTKKATAADFDACTFLFRGMDEDLFDEISNPPVSDEVLSIKAEAITNRRVNGSFAICNVGQVNNTDAIPQAANELLQLEGVTAVVIYGQKDGTIHLSGRSTDQRVHMGESLAAAVKDIPMASAGGHHHMGGGQLSVDHMEGIGPSGGISDEEFQERLLTALSGER